MRLFLVAGAILAASCATVIAPHQVRLEPESPRVPPPPISILAADVELGLDPLRRALEAAIPARSDGSQLLGALRVEAALVREPVQLSVAGGILVAAVTERGRLSLTVNGQACVADDARLGVEVRMRPAVSGDMLRLVDVQIGSRIAGRMRCKLGPASIGLDLPSQLSLPVPGLGAALEAIRLPIGFLADAGLDEARKPRPVSLGCLQLHPRRLVLSPTRGDGALSLTVGLEVAPQISEGACPATPTADARPDLHIVSAPLSGAFAVIVALPVQLAELEKRSQALVGKPIGQSGVVARHIALSGQAGRLVARITVDGPLVGDLILVGHPSVDVDDRLVLADLTLDFESRSAVQRLRFRLARALDRHLVETVQRAAAMDLTPLLKDARQALDTPFALGPATLALRPSAVRVHHLRVGADALHVEVVVEGHGLLTTKRQ